MPSVKKREAIPDTASQKTKKMTSTALVDVPEDVPLACIPKTSKKDSSNNPIPNSGKKYVMQFGKTKYYIPQSAILSYAKKPHVLNDGHEVGNLIATKAPDKWFEFCDPDTLMLIQGDDGSTCVYTTLAVAETDEQRFVRIISPTVAERNFPKWVAKLGIKIDEKTGKWDRSNEKFDSDKDSSRVTARRNVLKWRRENPLADADGKAFDLDLNDIDTDVPGCPTRAQLSPELSKWPAVPESDKIHSIRIAPETRKRPKGSSKDRTQVEEVEAKKARFVKSEEFIETGPPGSYSLMEKDGFIHVVHYWAKGEAEEADE
tara:strand:+ start:27653 stop:28603 length:951 start_codon:yes stop_codon:yes gene_type:complete